MKKNELQILLWSIGILQPASPTLVRHFLQEMLPKAFNNTTTQKIKEKFSWLQKNGFLAYALDGVDYIYSLTREGELALGPGIRKSRDKIRLFLLRDSASYIQDSPSSPERGLELTGDSPVVETRYVLQGRRPIAPAAGPGVRRYWPSTFKQLKGFAGPKPRSEFYPFDLYSFASIDELNAAVGTECDRNSLSLIHLALSIGVSSKLLFAISNNSRRYYRSFEIRKASGGMRTIHAPRIFLKTIQRWIVDYFLFQLPCHPGCHSFQRGKSIISNAAIHVGKKYVGNIDIADYFKSIKSEHLVHKLSKFFGIGLSRAISLICTHDDFLPQGAPSSPILSNFYLFDFDKEISLLCEQNELSYSRYADDITISGKEKNSIYNAINYSKYLLKKHNLTLNYQKTRVSSRGGQQNVTGVVVNQKINPPRSLRRNIRALFHNAQKNPMQYTDKIEMMRGYLSYLNMYESQKNIINKSRYEHIIDAIAAVKE
ncbi:RNA-directed DNA polymerase (Reverse transcriptase) [Desulfovibrio sp. X2]|uniref:retron St85 family RNA-directed DNA polymerase n=1 Tax=Desulfovibrio sp. X2 TaxID=941449 RepID=UPI000358E6D4|nr:retron St85 family RNA-directed DNA polymerase [Desulfovibrio sp. X2]EPR43525.1 RNA-directed DNA polymerase (Reverse transcriptase) [Desulfovibrio sp. X2]